MESQDKSWQELKARYLREVRKALSRVKHPRRGEILEEVDSHLERCYAELEPRRRTMEELRNIIEHMGPPAEYAELLSPEAAATGAARRLKCLFPAGLIAAVVLAAVLLPAALSQEKVAYIISFRAVAPFHPQTPAELLSAFNERHPAGVRTHHFRTKRDADTLTGMICVDTEQARDEVTGMLKQHDRLVLAGVRAATEDDFRAYSALAQLSPASSGDAQTYIVTFQPVPPFAPPTARELLDAFNANHPRGVRTHHFRTQVQEEGLIGHICVETQTGKDAVVSMLKESGRLEFVKAELANEQSLKVLYDMGQPSLKDAGDTNSRARTRSASRVREPSAGSPTVSRTGQWPPGDCSLAGQVFRRAWQSRIDHGAVCLTCRDYGSWTVEMGYHGRFEFRDLPPGTYTLKTADTAGYKDTYFKPENASDEPPSFRLTQGRREFAQIAIEPSRPYRRIQGTILNETDKPLANCTFLRVDAWVQRQREPRKGHFQPLSSSRVAQDGSYTLGELDGRPIYLQVHDSRPPVEEHPYPPCFYPGTFSRTEAKLVTSDDADVLHGLDITVRRAGGLTLEGVVTDGSSGKPVSEALVSIFHHDMPFDLFYTYTDGQGRYRLDGLGDGTFIVHVDAVHKGYVKTRKIVTSGPGVPRLDFALNRGVDVRGVLVDEKHQPYQVGRSFGSASLKKAGTRGAASNFPYGNKFAPDYIREGSTLVYEEGQGDAAGTMMVFPDETSFLLPAVAPGDIDIRFTPRGRGERVQAILHEGRDIQRTGLTVKPGQEVREIQIVVATGEDR